MNLHALNQQEPWDWPQEAGSIIQGVLADQTATSEDRLLAAEMAGDIPILDEALAQTLGTIIGNNSEDEELRSVAAIALGPTIELCDMHGFDDPEEVALSEKTFLQIQDSLKKLYLDGTAPELVRRRALEASVRAPQPWHQDAIRSAYEADKEDWQLTAVFCMQFVQGFEQQILDSLDSKNPMIAYHAVCAVGNWGLKKAWPHISQLLTLDNLDKDLLLAAIEAAAAIGSPEAGEKLLGLLVADDEDIIAATHEALAMIDEDFAADDYDDDDTVA